MSGKFLAAPLAALSATYRFVEGLRSSSRIDLASPIVLVHDVAAQAAHGASVLFQTSVTQISGGAGVAVFATVAARNTFFNRTPNFQPDRANMDAGRERHNSDVWLMSINCLGQTNTGNLANAAASYIPPGQEGGMVADVPEESLLVWGDVFDGGTQARAAGDIHMVLAQFFRGQTEVSPVRLPVLVDTVFMRLSDDAGAAVTVRWKLTFMITPRRAYPFPSL